MFQLKLNDIELVSKPEYYRKYIMYIIAIIGDPRMLETEGCAPVIAQRENQHPQSYCHGPITWAASARIIASSSAAVFLTFGIAAACRAPRLLSRGWRLCGQSARCFADRAEYPLDSNLPEPLRQAEHHVIPLGTHERLMPIGETLTEHGGTNRIQHEQVAPATVAAFEFKLPFG